MEIEIKNLKYGEVLTYSLPILVGEIESSTPVTLISVWNHAKPKTLSWPVKGNKFKALVELLPGENVIKLKCGDLCMDFSLVYEDLPSQYFVRPVYIKCSDDDGSFQAPESIDNSQESAQKRITLGAQLLQTFTAEKLNEQGLGRSTYKLERDSNRNLVCYLFTSKMTLKQAHSMSGNELWMQIAREFLTSDIPKKEYCKWFAFMSFTRYSVSDGFIPKTHAEILRNTKGHAALGGGGLALFGSGNLHTWADKLEDVSSCFSDTRKIDKTKLMDDSAYRMYYWANYSTGLGASLHELGHTFDLGHTPKGIMSRGFDDLYRFFTIQPPVQCKGLKNGTCCSLLQGPASPLHIPAHKRVQQRIRHNSAPSLVVHVETAFQRTKPECKQTITVRNYDGSQIKQVLDSSEYIGGSETCLNHVGIDNNSNKYLPKSQPGSVFSSPVRSPVHTYNNIGLDGGAFWYRSTAVILRYHRWFNSYEEKDPKAQSIEMIKGSIKSQYGLRIVELRSLPEGMVFHHWEFLTETPPNTFKVRADEVLELKPGALMVCVVVENIRGHVLKKKIPITELD